MTGRILAIALIVCALAAGGAVYYLQVYAFYEELPARESVPLVPMGAVEPRPVPVSDFEGIDSTSSPLRFRACFTVEASALAPYQRYETPTPLIAPGWFECFDAEDIAVALEEGRAAAYLSERDFQYGFDRVVAAYPDGRAYAWHQLNACGTALYDGDPLPADCPPPPDSVTEDLR